MKPYPGIVRSGNDQKENISLETEPKLDTTLTKTKFVCSESETDG